ncbi:type I 3-dehydroquinate dehydratase [Halococcus sp. IIIV-5B]|uniref:type I 3-dehydroquinate dehydratase n=1 Tax=Halococcus sp. IIIV-5B TaxID=2321230 RepID=UPI000E72198C|nr:type I 3-dehydroquinate dehydratase [Halococcus sp. IIIV-5B]RJS98090.1 type I 3-dehydroquinate dehydratase [Halococcus sp. IIIV-5B]
MNFETPVLAAATADLADEPAAREHADAVEFRMDLAESPLDALGAYDGDLPLIATNRTVEEGGEAEAEGRLAALERAVEHSLVEAVDVELAAVDEADSVIDHARENGVEVIVSAHDFSGTPSRVSMRETLTSAVDHGDVGKLAITADSREDVLALLAVTDEIDTAGHAVATMAMGEVGRHSRAVAPQYGSRIAYAPVDPGEATAPGQYDLATLANLLNTL